MKARSAKPSRTLSTIHRLYFRPDRLTVRTSQAPHSSPGPAAFFRPPSRLCQPAHHLFRPSSTPPIYPGCCPASPPAGAITFIYLGLSAPFTPAAYRMRQVRLCTQYHCGQLRRWHDVRSSGSDKRTTCAGRHLSVGGNTQRLGPGGIVHLFGSRGKSPCQKSRSTAPSRKPIIYHAVRWRACTPGRLWYNAPRGASRGTGHAARHG
jgi:hypothetical protein